MLYCKVTMPLLISVYPMYMYMHFLAVVFLIPTGNMHSFISMNSIIRAAC